MLNYSLPLSKPLFKPKALAVLGSLLLAAALQAQTINFTSSSQLTLNLGASASPVSLSGGNGTFTVSLLSGSLPPGISLRSSGFPAGWNATASPYCLCGVATTPGRFNSTLRIVSGSTTLDQAYTIDVASAVDPNPTALPDALTNASYSHQLRNASAAVSPSYFWSLAPGSTLPAGLSLSSSGLISGTAGAPGTFSFFTLLADGGFGFSRVQHTITVRAFNLTSSSTLPAATQNVAYNQALSTGSGSTGALTFSVVFGALPTGLSLNPSTGAITGTPTAFGSYRFAIQVRDASFRIAQKTFALQVLSAPPTLISYTGEPFTRLADLTIGTFRAHEIPASNGVAPYTFTLRSGSQLPPGMTLLTGTHRPNAITSNDFQAVVAGAPTTLGAYTFTIDITDSSASPVTTSKTYTINIGSLFTVLNPPTANQGAAYSFTMQPLGGSNSYTLSYPVGYQPNVFTGQVRLPNGLSFNAGTRTIAGTPTEAGTFYLPFEISDGSSTLRQVITLVVNSVSPIAFCSNSLFPSATLSTAYNFQPCLGGVSPYTVNILSGSLPPGLSFTTTGALTGLPTAPGVYNFLAQFVDSSGSPRSVTAYITLSVQNMFPNLSSPLPAATIGTAYSQNITIGGSDPSLQISVEPDSVLPPGLTLNAGVLSGVPSVIGLYTFNLRFTSTQGPGGFYVQPFALSVDPPPSNGTTTTPAALSTTFSSATQNLNLTAAVTSASGTVNLGTVTFTVRDGSNIVVGSPVTSGTVSANSASATFVLPASQAAGAYTIQAVYNPAGPFLGSSGNNTLTVTPATVTLTPTATGVSFSGSTQTLNLAATLTSAGTVSGGTVTFTVRDSLNVIVGAPVLSGVVAAGSATASLTLPASQAIGSYSIQATYSGAGNFAAANNGVGSFSISPASTTVSASLAANPSFSANSQAIAISVAVSSPAGSVNGGTPSALVRDGSNNVIGSVINATAVVNGSATVNYTLPAAQATGAYTIEVSYPGSGNFAASTGSGSFNITASNTTVSVAAASATFSSSAQNINLAATITGSGGTVSGGTVTFTVRNSSNAVIGAPVVSPAVANNQASISFSFPASTPAGAYTVEAAYSGGGNFNASTGTGALTVTGLSTSTMVNFLGVAFSAAAQTVSLSANVIAGGNPVTGGTVTFTVVDSFNSAIAPSVVSGPVTSGSATASFTIPAGQSVGVYLLQAVYGNSTNFASSSSASGLEINGASTTLAPAALVATFNTAAQSLTFSATLTSSGTPNSGTVNFSATFPGGSVNVTGPVVNGNANAAFTLPAGTPVGAYFYTANYSGGGNFGATGSTGVINLNAANTTTTPAALTTPASATQTVINLSTTVTSPSGNVNSGTVTFALRDGSNNLIGSAQTSATAAVAAGFAATAWVVPANQAAGTYFIYATYNGALNVNSLANLNVSNGNANLTISSANTVLSVPAASRSFTAAATPVTLLASVTGSAGTVNGGTVTFTITDGSSAVVGAPVVSPTVANGSVAVSYPLPASLAGAVYNVSAAYSGFGSFAAANAVSTFTVTPATTNSTTPALTAIYSPSNQSINVTATTTSPAGTVNGGSVVFNFRDSSNNLVFGSPVSGTGPVNGASTGSFTLPGGTLPGAYTVQVVYSGSSNFNTSNGTSALTLNGLTTTTVPTAPATVAFSPAQQTLSFTALVSSSSPVNGGTVNFTLRDSANNTIGLVTGSAPVASGAAAVNFSLPAATPPGTYTLQANYLGSNIFGLSSGSTTLVVVGAATTTALSAPLSPLTLGSSVALTATVAPLGATGRVTFFDGALVLGSATLSSGSATFTTRLLSAGNHTIRAVYAGDSTYSSSTSSTLARLVVANLAGAFLSAPGSPFSAGSAPSATTAGDFNGDGFNDIAAVSSSGLYILLGNGTGGVSTTVGPLVAGSFPSGVAAGDFNADGRLDVAVSNFGSNNLSVFVNNGSNSYTASTFTAGNGPSAIAFSDFNGDGLLDLVASNQSSSSLTLLRNNGAGSFTPFAATPSIGTGPVSLAIADFNNDNRADIAVSNSGSNNVSVLIGAGDGSFTTTTLAAGSTPATITAADFDGNGNTDIAVTNRNSSNLSLFLNAGNASFAAAANTATSANPSALAAGDFNGDGSLDLAYSATNGVTTLSGSGTGTFTPRQTTTATGVSSLLAVEFSADGLADLAFTTGSAVEVILGRLASTTTTVSAASAPFSAASQPLTLTANVTSTSGTVNGGTFTFTVRDGSNNVIGSPVTSGPIAAGTASALFTIPASQTAGTYTVTAVFSGAGTFATSTGSNTLLITSPSTIVITSNPVGLTIVVDGVPVTTPATFTNWGAPGTPHTLAANTNPGTPGTQYVFASWSQGGAASQTVNTPNTGTTYTANFTTQYQFTGNVAGPGTLTPASGWVNAGTVLAVTATPNASANFVGFAGDLTGTTTPQNLTMSAPRTVSATFVAGAPVITASLPGTNKVNGTLTDERVWTFVLNNTGTAPASNLQITNVTFSTPVPTGATLPTISANTTLPVVVGTVANGASSTGTVRVIYPTTLTRCRVTITVTPDGGLTTQTLILNNVTR
jgi:hypothetical protein